MHLSPSLLVCKTPLGFVKEEKKSTRLVRCPSSSIFFRLTGFKILAKSLKSTTSFDRVEHFSPWSISIRNLVCSNLSSSAFQCWNLNYTLFAFYVQYFDKVQNCLFHKLPAIYFTTKEPDRNGSGRLSPERFPQKLAAAFQCRRSPNLLHRGAFIVPFWQLRNLQFSPILPFPSPWPLLRTDFCQFCSPETSDRSNLTFGKKQLGRRRKRWVCKIHWDICAYSSDRWEFMI